MNMLALSIALALSAPLLCAQDLLEGGAFDRKPADWRPFPAKPVAGASATYDGEHGFAENGCLRLYSEKAADEGIRMWERIVKLRGQKPTRLRLSCAVSAKKLGGESTVQLMAQLWPEKGDAFGYPRTLALRKDSGWQETDVVFDVPARTDRIRLLFFLTGKGTAYLDDVRLEPTDANVTYSADAAPRRNDPVLEALARGAADNVEWVFDGARAREIAAKEDKPVLLYVRCTDAKGGVEALGEALDAPAISMGEDGFAKDVLFRAGPLSTPRIADFIGEHFVPAIACYDLGGSAGRSLSPPGWMASGDLKDAKLVALEGFGAASPGCLSIDAKVKGNLRMWGQSIEWSGEEQELVLSAAMAAVELDPGGEVNVMLQCWKGEEALLYPRLKPLKSKTDWTTSETTFTVPEGVDKIRLLAYLRGTGTVHLDDLAIRRTGEEENLLVNGDLSETQPDERTLDGFPVHPGDVTTPGLCVFSAAGELVAKLDRQGALSDVVVSRWLETALAAADPEGGKHKVAGAAREVRTVSGLMTGGEWERAADALARAGKDVTEEGTFLRALCLHRLGRAAEADTLWRQLASETPWGRKAAACALAAGPRLQEAITVREWRDDVSLFATTENSRAQLDVERSVLSLLELQRRDGSFGSQFGSMGQGWNDPAITAIALDAFLATREGAGRREKKRLDVAIDRGVEFLVRYAGGAATPRLQSAAFNNPYVLHTLLRLEELDAARVMVSHIVAGQEEDGNWTVYGPQRPASFNTAQNTMALIAARTAELDVPDGVIDRGLDALETMRDASGLFPYSSAPGHGWMTTDHGAIGRDPLCEHALLAGGRGSIEALDAALRRYLVHGEELRVPTKRLYNYFNGRGHGGYFFFFAHRRALEAAEGFGLPATVMKVRAFVREQVLAAQEGDGTFMDKFNLGRSYGTAQALVLLVR